MSSAQCNCEKVDTNSVLYVLGKPKQYFDNEGRSVKTQHGWLGVDRRHPDNIKKLQLSNYLLLF